MVILRYFFVKISEQGFTDMYGIQFHGAQQRRKYLLHVEAKLKSKFH
mgnify:FL=1